MNNNRFVFTNPTLPQNLSLRKSFGLLLILLTTLFNTSLAQNQQTGAVQGTVTTSDGKPAEYVSVGIIGTNSGTSTSEKGTFKINRVKPGTYTLSVSAVNITPQQKQITITAGATTTINFMLDISDLKLQEVVVKDQNNRIKIDNPSLTLRLQEPLLQIPQNIQVVSGQAIAEQQIISMSDGLIRNVSGAVRLEHWGDMYTNITMRGSQVQAFRNGFNVVSSFWGPLTEDMSFVDHIEFVKGPAGFMLGNGDPAGLYNVVTKKPTGQTKGEFSLTTGSFGLYRSALDLDGKLSKDGKFLYRLNVAGQSKGSFRANEFNNRYSIAPVISYQIDDKTKITAEYNYQHANMSDVGSFYVFSRKGYAALPRDFSDLPPGLIPTNINDHSFTVNLQHQFNTNWKLTAQAAYYKYYQLGSSMWADSVGTDGRSIRNSGIWEAKSDMTLMQAFLNGKFTTAGIQHKLLTGIDMGTKNYFADYAQTYSLDTKAAMFDPADPSTLPPSNGYPVYDRSLNLEARAAAGFGIINQTYSSIYLQDVIGFMDERLRLTLAGRYTYVKQASFGDQVIGKRFTPRIGLSFSVDNQTSIYGLYDQAFIPQTAGRLVEGSSIKPITGNNLEFGIKKDWGQDSKWNTTVAVYRILKNNEAQADASSTPQNPVSFLLGQKRSQGIEFDLRGELLPGLNLTANYALTDSKVSKVGVNAASTISVGDVVPGYAKHTANAWLNYKLQNGTLKGTGFSLGGTYLGGRQTDTWSVGLERLPNYFKMDGGLFWEGTKMRVTANAFNILDKYTYSGSYYSYLNAYYWQADAPRSYRLSIAYRF
jgi:iron complex outermembrane receptor protein